MKKILVAAAAAMALAAMAACGSKKDSGDASGTAEYVTVKDGQFVLGDSVYKFVGTNFWYAPILGSEGRGGDRARLVRELDMLDSIGVNNLRVLVGADGPEGLPAHISPVLQEKPGIYNDTLLAGLDFFMAEIEKRDMKAVLYFNNAWEWSGGYSSYLIWAGDTAARFPGRDGYRAYVDYVKRFMQNDSAKRMSLDHVKYIVSRTNTITGKPYTESPALMAWQVANEPRAFSRENKPLLLQYIDTVTTLVRSLDPNHLISTGSEGLVGCEMDLDLWKEIHSLPNVDYGLIHLWPTNWGWSNRETMVSRLDSVCIMADEYIGQHFDAYEATGKPIVLEEFGYPRDGWSFTPGSATTARDKFYENVFAIIRDSGRIAGCNFWAWGGEAQPLHNTWQDGDPYCGDPAQEPQGLFSVFAADTSTVNLIHRYANSLHKK